MTEKREKMLAGFHVGGPGPAGFHGRGAWVGWIPGWVGRGDEAGTTGGSTTLGMHCVPFACSAGHAGCAPSESQCQPAGTR